MGAVPITACRLGPQRCPDFAHRLPHRRPGPGQASAGHCRGHGGGSIVSGGPQYSPGGRDRMTRPLLALAGLTKAYPGVIANRDVSFEIEQGEVHALLGENGAGKSTLVKAIYGLVKPDSGAMHLDGKPHEPNDPKAARAAGITMVFQHFSLFDALTVAENVALGMENPPPLRDLSTRIREVSDQYGLPLDPTRIVGDLSAGERQRVEIIRCLLQDPKLLI